MGHCKRPLLGDASALKTRASAARMAGVLHSRWDVQGPSPQDRELA